MIVGNCSASLGLNPWRIRHRQIPRQPLRLKCSSFWCLETLGNGWWAGLPLSMIVAQIGLNDVRLAIDYKLLFSKMKIELHANGWSGSNAKCEGGKNEGNGTPQKRTGDETISKYNSKPKVDPTVKRYLASPERTQVTHFIFAETDKCRIE